MFTDKSQFASAFTALVTPEDELIVIESPRETRELEMPGGGVDTTDVSVRSAADREVKEESGIDTHGLFAYGQVELSSRLGSAKTGLIVVTLAQKQVDEIDFSFSSNESRRLVSIPMEDFIALPTKDEDPDAPLLTFRAHRVMASVALFQNECVGNLQNRFYQTPVDA